MNSHSPTTKTSQQQSQIILYLRRPYGKTVHQSYNCKTQTYQDLIQRMSSTIAKYFKISTQNQVLLYEGQLLDQENFVKFSQNGTFFKKDHNIVHVIDRKKVLLDENISELNKKQLTIQLIRMDLKYAQDRINNDFSIQPTLKGVPFQKKTIKVSTKVGDFIADMVLGVLSNNLFLVYSGQKLDRQKTFEQQFVENNSYVYCLHKDNRKQFQKTLQGKVFIKKSDGSLEQSAYRSALSKKSLTGSDYRVSIKSPTKSNQKQTKLNQIVDIKRQDSIIQVQEVIQVKEIYPSSSYQTVKVQSCKVINTKSDSPSALVTESSVVLNSTNQTFAQKANNISKDLPSTEFDSLIHNSQSSRGQYSMDSFTKSERDMKKSLDKTSKTDGTTKLYQISENKNQQSKEIVQLSIVNQQQSSSFHQSQSSKTDLNSQQYRQRYDSSPDIVENFKTNDQQKLVSPVAKKKSSQKSLYELNQYQISPSPHSRLKTSMKDAKNVTMECCQSQIVSYFQSAASDCIEETVIVKQVIEEDQDTYQYQPFTMNEGISNKESNAKQKQKIQVVKEIKMIKSKGSKIQEVDELVPKNIVTTISNTISANPTVHLDQQLKKTILDNNCYSANVQHPQSTQTDKTNNRKEASKAYGDSLLDFQKQIQKKKATKNTPKKKLPQSQIKDNRGNKARNELDIRRSTSMEYLSDNEASMNESSEDDSCSESSVVIWRELSEQMIPSIIQKIQPKNLKLGEKEQSVSEKLRNLKQKSFKQEKTQQEQQVNGDGQQNNRKFSLIKAPQNTFSQQHHIPHHHHQQVIQIQQHIAIQSTTEHYQVQYTNYQNHRQTAQNITINTEGRQVTQPISTTTATATNVQIQVQLNEQMPNSSLIQDFSVFFNDVERCQSNDHGFYKETKITQSGEIVVPNIPSFGKNKDDSPKQK